MKIYKTGNTIINETKGDLAFITYDFDFAVGKDRFLSAVKRNALVVKQQQLFNVDFDKFLDRLYAHNLDEKILKAVEDMYYEKPLYAYAIAAGGLIDFKKIEEKLVKANNIATQTEVLGIYNSQLIVAALKGVVRDYYSVLLCLQEGYEGRASRSFMGNFNLLLEHAAIYVGIEPDDEVYTETLRLIDNLKFNLKQIRNIRTLENAEDLTLHSNKLINEFSNKFYGKCH